tara:strand:- start:242 stop:1546 length:1305 start_codon:yes stop_codon:yes gene_type:complete
MEEQMKKMYTLYPYPNYDSKHDKYAPIPAQYSPFSFLEQINHYLYNGKKNFNNFRVLVAGCGIGGDVVSLGFLLKEYKGSNILAIDISPESLRITKERIKLYNLDNIEVREMSLLDINPKDFGYFDFIVCIGVLHHLEYPQSGLNKLRQVLKPDGGMYIMVYGEIGRTGVYQMQDLLNMVNKNTNNFANKIINFKNIYSILPSSNLLKKTENVIHDHNTGDNGIVDELLNLQDRAYTVSELYKFVKSVGMNIVEFSPMDRYKYKFSIPNIDYKNISEIEKYSINELFFGDICKHSIYISNRTNTIALIDDLDNIMIYNFILKDNLLKIISYYESNNKLNKLNVASLQLMHVLPDNKFNWHNNSFSRFSFSFSINPYIYFILKSIDNETSTLDIFNNLRNKFGIKCSNNSLLQMFKPIYKIFEMYDLILLKNINC